MSTTAGLSGIADKVLAGRTLSEADAAELVAATDLVRLGMIADDRRRALRGDAVTFVRVATLNLADPVPAEPKPPAAREVRVLGAPASEAQAVSLVRAAADWAQGTPLTGFALGDLARLVHPGELAGLLKRLSAAGLHAVDEIRLDVVPEAASSMAAVAEAGLKVSRCAVGTLSLGALPEWCRRVDALQAESGVLQAVAPLPRGAATAQPSTGYDDVKAVAIARILLERVTVVQVDWQLHGPKLAQVALMFGADDLDLCSPLDAAPLGPRRTALADLTRNIVAASRTPVERTGLYERSA